MTSLLQVDGVHKRYGQIEVLRGISLQAAAGEIFAIIGPNGAGKTTMFRVMTGEVPCDAGTIRFRDRDVTRMPAYLRVREGFGRTFQVARIFQEDSVLDNVVAAIEARRRYQKHSGKQGVGSLFSWSPPAEVVSEAMDLLADVRLDAQAKQDARFLSHGDKKRLELVLALAGKPSVLMLDEPTAGMSMTDRQDIARLIGRIRKEHGVTVVMTEHDMDVVFGLADRIMVMNYGTVVATGSVSEIRNDPKVREVYLGKEMVNA